MVQAMFLAHLLGDYVLQPDFLACWKNHSTWGVLAHGLVVTLSLWLCSLPFTLDWWPWALGIGAVHVLLDVLRARIGSAGPIGDLILFLGDQAVHMLIIGVGLAWTGWLKPRPAGTALGAWLQAENHLTFVIGYVLLTMPAWVLTHFLARATGTQTTSLPGRPGEKYIGMIERGLVATLVLLGQFILVPLVVVPRLILDRQNRRVETERFGYLNELLISMGLAVTVGLFLRNLI